MLMFSWKFWSLLSTVYIHGKPHRCLYHSVMPSSARLIGISFYQFSFTTNAEKLIVFQAMHFISFRYIYIFFGLKTLF